MREIGHFIGGKTVTGTSGRFGAVFDPNTGEIQARVALAAKAEVETAIASAVAAQAAWAAANPPRRARVTSTERRSPIPAATSSVASRWWNSPAAFRI
jgi:malonate-semialdehyde dehydrogenase (acetylating)/methylmalonate-semialdehyde dehydrogenase